MQLKTILNRVHPQPGFVYETVRLVEGAEGPSLDVEIRARANGRAVCSGCGIRRPGYDRQEVRRFEFVPLWGMLVFLCYEMRRVDCRRCGVKVERVPWAEGKHQVTTAYAWFLAGWAKRLSWKEVAEAFRTSWETVFRSVEMAVAWGREHQDLGGIAAVGIDEIHWSRRQGFLTLVYQIDEGCRRLLWVGRHRQVRTLLRFFRWFGTARTRQLKYVCSDMWKPYLRVVAKKAGHALHVLDRFHIMSHMSKAIDEVRSDEVRSLKLRGLEPVLKHKRWLLLKRVENLTEAQDVSIAQLVGLNLRSVRAYLLKEWFQYFWEYRSPVWAGRFLDRWCYRTMRSRLEPMKKVAKMLRRHRALLMNWFRVRGTVALGAVEGFNNKARVTTKRSYGFRSYDLLELALYQTLGQLPEPEGTHRFC
jgi:transposase